MCFIVNSDLNRYIIIIMIIHEFFGSYVLPLSLRNWYARDHS